MADFITLENGLRVRHGVGMLFLNRDNQLLMGKRAGTEKWQLPQGGRDHADLGLIQAEAAREMREELGILPHDVMYATTLPKTTYYELPLRMRQRGFDAQSHHWLVYHYLPQGIPDLAAATDHEFDDVAWGDFERLMKSTSPFRHWVYTQVRMMYLAYRTAA